MKHKNLLLALPFAFFVFAGISLSSCKDTPVRKLYKSDIDWKLTFKRTSSIKTVHPIPKMGILSLRPFCRDNNFVTFVKDGKLVLRALPNNDPNDTIRYMAGCVETLGKKIFCTGALKYVPNWAVLKVMACHLVKTNRFDHIRGMAQMWRDRYYGAAE